MVLIFYFLIRLRYPVTGYEPGLRLEQIVSWGNY